MDKKNIVFIGCSIDGYIAGKNGELDWLHSVPNPSGEDMGYSELMNEIDAIVMGRTTFETVCGFDGAWPYTKPVIVLSNSIKVIPDTYKGKASLMSGSPENILRELHDAGLYKLYIDGGRTIQDFMKADLIDELRITTIPILLGEGFSLFGELPEYQSYELIASQTYLKQVVQSRYARKRSSLSNT